MKVLQKMVSLAMTGAMVIGLGSGIMAAERSVKIDSAHFPDAGFRSYLRSVKCDKNGDGYLSETEISKIDKLNFYSNDDVESVKGIKYLTSVTELTFFECYLDDVDLSQNPNIIKVMILSCNGIKKLTTGMCVTSLEVSFCPNFKELDVESSTYLSEFKFVSNNRFKGTIDLSECRYINDVTVYNNAASGITFHPKANPKYIHIEDNNMPDQYVNNLYK